MIGIPQPCKEMEKMELKKIPIDKLFELKKRLIKTRKSSNNWWFWFGIYKKVIEEIDRRKPVQKNLFKKKIYSQYKE